MTAPVLDINDVIAEAAAAALPAPEPVVEETTAPVPEATDLEEVPEDDAPDAEVAEEAPVDVPDAEAAPVEEVALPDGYVAVPTIAEGLVTDFALFDEDGEVEVPALMVEYKANGKVRKDRLDQVVKLAQWGVYNQDRQAKLEQDAASKEQQYTTLLQEREQQMERLLTDEGFLEAVREAYFEENSPEKRAERAEQRVENLKVQHQMQAIEQQGLEFLTKEVEPAISLMAAALPSVSAEELESRITMAMQAHAEVGPNGAYYVPPSRYDAIRQYIVEDLAIWAQTVNAKRSQPAATPKKAALQAELDKARIEAQKAKNLVGKAIKPTGQAGKVSDAPNKPKAPATVDDAVDSALKAALASFSP
jgi:hypothetical protein